MRRVDLGRAIGVAVAAGAVVLRRREEHLISNIPINGITQVEMLLADKRVGS